MPGGAGRRAASPTFCLVRGAQAFSALPGPARFSLRDKGNGSGAHTAGELRWRQVPAALPTGGVCGLAKRAPSRAALAASPGRLRRQPEAPG